jgi:DNA-binding transcriptional MerR regulator
MMFQTFPVGIVAAPETMQQTFTSNEVVELTGITLRQLQWWDERGIVAPEREGHKRVYSPDDLAEVAVICDLRQRGFSLQKVRAVIRFLQRELGKRLVETVTAASEYHLLTDGRHIYLEDSARAVVDLLKNARQPMLSVCLSDTIQRVLHPLEARKPPRHGDLPAAEARSVKLAPSAAAKKRDSSIRHPNVRRRRAS